MEGEGKQMEDFLKWAANQGISDCPNHLLQSSPSSTLGQSLLISQFPDAGGRGLAAARDLRKGEPILRVPRPALLTSESVLKDARLAVSVKRRTYLSSIQVLAVCLLAEVGKGRASWWYPYLVQLPHTYNTLSSFTPFGIRALQVDDAIWTSEKAVSRAQSDWKEALALMKELELKPQLLSFRSWLWASATISSRTLHIPWDEAGCLCPVGDFFNYAAPEEESLFWEDVESMEGAPPLQISSLGKDKDVAEKLDVEGLERHSQRLTDGGYEEDVAAYCFYARKRYRKGEQVLLCYGTYTNLELLDHYGFLLNENPNEKAFIRLDMGMGSTNPWPKDSLYIQQDGKPSFALLSALRLSVTAPKLRKAVGHLAYSGSILSAENEISVMKWVSKKCRDLLEEMPTSIEEDSLLLCSIEKLQNHPIPEEVVEMLACGGELCDFFEVNGLQKGAVSEFLLPGKAKRSMERWKLAVQWRFRYKRILSDCISYCSNMNDHFSSQQVSGMSRN
ncbi:protein SET DOMAIN GROUP 40 isoform X1 [Magnolia sinica]|uniref:protein SET DOMAIN GROUP 40 isoform X1 n=1 Tax=Magnolia sinica TaxID=86752 RepID=UPI002659DD5B|nr:protein SET DOMAIN GROUP 40 isoform X1 [Magnolia sinica]